SRTTHTMESLEKRWQVSPLITPEADQNLNAYPLILRQILFNRGIATTEEAKIFLAAEMPKHDMYTLSEMDAAVARVVGAIENEEKITVYGDYDADGVTSSALMVQALSALKAKVNCYIPNRFDEGYGLNIPAIDKLKAEGTELVITVDCGIRALPQAEHAKKIGLDLIITDHHTPGKELPWANALLNPKKPGDHYPEKNLAGVGMAFKLASALIEHLKPADFTTDHLVDLVAIGTVADMVPLIGENRALVRRGLGFLRRPHRQGILSLLGILGVKATNVVASNIGFGIGPRLNAAGRLASALDAYQLLITTDVVEAGQLAQKLDNRNRERQKITREIQEQIEENIDFNEAETFLIFAADPNYNPGVVGLSASRLVESFYRPAIVAHQGEKVTRGSGRSIPEFHITHALEQCADLLEHYGGHAAAAGFTVKNSNLEAFIAKIKMIAREELSGQDLRPILHADADVQLDALNFELLADLDKLQPTGYGNPDPVFLSLKVRPVSTRTVGKDKSHLKMTVSQEDYTFDAIAFRQGHWAEKMPEYIDMVYAFELNEFNGQKKLQLNIKDIRASE
ncbi:MAG: single-stranded-DNA-specific exonuclease RecJ, partial [Chloroflexota bacterium]